MRFPVTPELSTKDGVTNENGRLFNALKETRPSGETLAIVRPGLVYDAQASGVGNGLVCYNGQLISVFGASLGYPSVTDSGQIVESFYNIAGVQLLDMCAFNGGWLCASADQIHHTSDFVTFTPILTPGVYEIDATSGTAGQGIATNGTVGVTPFYNLDTDAQGFMVISTAYGATEVAKTYTPNLVIWSGSVFCAMRSATQSVTSSDGTTWTDGVAFSGALYGQTMAYGGGVFCLLGTELGTDYLYARTSSDGLSWTAAVYIANLTGLSTNVHVCWAGDRFVAVGLDWVSTSTDGVTWSALSYPFPYNFFAKSIEYNSTPDCILALGSYAYYGDMHTKMLSFDNGVTWIDTNDASYNGIEYNACIPYGSGFIAFGSTVVSGASNNIEVISSVASVPGMTNIASLVNARIDFVQSPL